MPRHRLLRAAGGDGVTVARAARRVAALAAVAGDTDLNASLKADERKRQLETLHRRFEQHPERHRGIDWATVQQRLDGNAAALASLRAMDASGGEPDVIGRDGKAGPVLYCDCSEQTPAGRRSLCFDAEALAARKANKPQSSAQAMAEAMGIELLDESQYQALQALGEFDTKTSSWLLTPAAVRERGGALFGDRRYGRVFVYHNGAESYYAVRGFRGLLRV